MTKINNKRKLDEETIKKLQDILQANVELLNAYDFKELYNIANKSLMSASIPISNLTYLLVVAGIDPLNYMDEIPIECFYMCDDLVSIEIPNNITSINDFAFYGCSALTSVIIGNNMTYIGSYAFGKCSGLTSITIPDSVTKIGSFAFSRCDGLTSITIPNSVTSIGGSAFYNCYGLTSVIIPDSVTSIGRWAFYGCSSLKSIDYLGTKKQWNNLLKYTNSIPKNCIIHCSDGDI